jgi:hypothetical protein
LGNYIWTPIDVAIMLFSPAIGAVLAPLALMFVQSEPFICFSFLTRTSRRVPVQTINANRTTTRPPPSHKTRNSVIAALASLGLILTVLALIGVAVVQIVRWWKQKQSRPRPTVDSDDDYNPTEADWQAPPVVSDLTPYSSGDEIFPDSRNLTRSRERVPLIATEDDSIALNPLSQTSTPRSPPTELARPLRVVSGPDGLPCKEMVRLRTRALAGGGGV